MLVSYNTKYISVYTNPATSNVNVTITSNIKSLKVMNILGQVVYSQFISTENIVNINTENFDFGTYFILLTTDEGKKINKLFVIVK